MKFCDSCRSSFPADFTTCPKDSGPLRALTELAAGMVLRGKYEVLTLLGSGGMGAVYKARHVLFGELRALKVLSAHIADDPGYLARFRSEAALARRLMHENAVRVEDFDSTEDGRPFIVMECVEGTSLRQLLRHNGPLGLPRAIELTRQACAALAAAHALGIVHRDVKPENMALVNKPGRGELLKVLDFGLAKVQSGYEGSGGQVSTRTGMVVGTPEYMSPEQALGTPGEELDGRADIYALGVVLYEMVTGRVPFHGETPVATIFAHVQQEPTPPSALRPGLPPAMEDVILKALAKDRGSRFATAEEMAKALAAVRFESAPARTMAAPTVEVRRPVPRPRSTPLAAAPTAAAQGKRIPSPAPPSRPARPQPAATHEPSNRWAPAARTAAVLAVLGGLVWVGVRNGSEGRTAATPPAELVAPPATGTEPSAAPSDAELQGAVQQLLFRSTALSASRIGVQVVNGIVTLDGEAPSAVARDLAVSLAQTVPGVKRVFSTVQVGTEAPPSMAGTTVAATPAPDDVPEAPARLPPPPPDPRVRQLLDEARAAMATRNPARAQQLFEEVLRLDPGNPIAEMGLEHIRRGPPVGPAGRRPPPP